MTREYVNRKTLKEKPNLFNLIILYLCLIVFFFNGIIWSLKEHKYKSMAEILNNFYFRFLRLKKEELIVEKINETELITISKNDCPILKLSLLLKVDTRFSCKFVSERVCRFVIKRMNSNLEFERDYSYIRPYSNGCKERIFRVNKLKN